MTETEPRAEGKGAQHKGREGRGYRLDGREWPDGLFGSRHFSPTFVSRRQHFCFLDFELELRQKAIYGDLAFSVSVLHVGPAFAACVAASVVAWVRCLRVGRQKLSFWKPATVFVFCLGWINLGRQTKARDLLSDRNIPHDSKSRPSVIRCSKACPPPPPKQDRHIPRYHK